MDAVGGIEDFLDNPALGPIQKIARTRLFLRQLRAHNRINSVAATQHEVNICALGGKAPAATPENSTTEKTVMVCRSSLIQLPAYGFPVGAGMRAACRLEWKRKYGSVGTGCLRVGGKSQGNPPIMTK
jgi:hypothetical protein